MPDHVNTFDGIELHHHPELDGRVEGSVYAVTTGSLQNGDSDRLFVPDPDVLREMANDIERREVENAERVRPRARRPEDADAGV